MPKRFSKATLTEHLQARVDLIQEHWGFDPNNGTYQIPLIAADRARTNPLESYEIQGSLSEQAHLAAALRAYGELSTLAAIADEFNLELVQTKDMYPHRIGRPGQNCIRYRPN